jgi:hypothetical protein
VLHFLHCNYIYIIFFISVKVSITFRFVNTLQIFAMCQDGYWIMYSYMCYVMYMVFHYNIFSHCCMFEIQQPVFFKKINLKAWSHSLNVVLANYQCKMWFTYEKSEWEAKWNYPYVIYYTCFWYRYFSKSYEKKIFIHIHIYVCVCIYIYIYIYCI